MRVDLVVPTYNQAAGVERLVESTAGSRHDVVVHLFLHSSDDATRRACERLGARPDVRHRPHGVNRGLSRSWNDGIVEAFDESADVVVIANDDVAFGEGDLDRLAEKAVAHRDRYIVSCAGYHERLRRRLPSHGYACFALNPVALDVLGCFDENFCPAYCEDQDYARRAALAGLTEENCSDTSVVHTGSSAILASPELRLRNTKTQALNMAYYRRKWGGLAGEERFDRPFGDATLDLRIAPGRRARPYGPRYDRDDLTAAVA